MYSFIRQLAHSRRAALITQLIRTVLPRPVGIALFGWLGTVAYRLSADLRASITSNMSDLLSSVYAPNELHRFARGWVQNVAATMAELLIYAKSAPQAVDRILQITGRGWIDAALARGKGAILYTSHTGNFFYYYLWLSQRYPALVVATASDPDLGPLYTAFHELGCEGLDYNTTPPLEMLRRLRAHLASNGVVVLLGDFYRSTFPESRLFGRPTRAPRGAASLALDLGVPIIPFYGYRLKGIKHRLIFKPEFRLSGFTRRESASATVALNQHVERVITEHPADWFYWFNCHERWEGCQNETERNRTAPGRVAHPMDESAAR